MIKWRHVREEPKEEKNYLVVTNGIEAASVAWQPLGWKAVGFSEIDKFPSALLAHHYPTIPNFGDLNNYEDWLINESIDVICGGTPCQSFSVAGQRKSLDDDRGNLSLTFCRMCDYFDPEIIIWENVPGVLNTKDNAFGCFLAALAGEASPLQPPRGKWSYAGYVSGPKRAIAWRVLDAQYFGLAQRRKRVFVIASAREDICPAEILFEFNGVRRDTPPCREARQETTPNAGTGFTVSSFGGYAQGVGTLRANGGDLGGGSETLVAQNLETTEIFSRRNSGLDGTKWPADVASRLNASYGSKLGLENQHIDGGAPLFVPAKAYGVPGNWIGRKPENGGNSTQPMHEVAPAQTATDRHGVVAFNSRQDPISGEVFGALDTSSPQAQAIAIQGTVIGRKPENGPQGQGYDKSGVCFTQASTDRHAVATNAAVRRLTPIECERLQGFPDNYTQIPWRGRPANECPDGHRYKALGNSWAVPVVRWIGERIEMVKSHDC
ncbi:hypothetical protein AAEX37_01993 [Oligella sp. MSHR50489EDL]|uniref:DNA cytosine methyltransferase n=1 Tax=Oligella sp. MSHR50489EDL TaxID=3139409 RepID=UPI003D81446E